MNQKDVNSLLVKHDTNAEIVKLYAERARLENDLSKWQEMAKELAYACHGLAETRDCKCHLCNIGRVAIANFNKLRARMKG